MLLENFRSSLGQYYFSFRVQGDLIINLFRSKKGGESGIKKRQYRACKKIEGVRQMTQKVRQREEFKKRNITSQEIPRRFLKELIAHMRK